MPTKAMRFEASYSSTMNPSISRRSRRGVGRCSICPTGGGGVNKHNNNRTQQSPMKSAVAATQSVMTDGLRNLNEENAPATVKVLAALLYALASLFIVFANKLLFVAEGVEFPSFRFVALSQYVGTAAVLWLQNWRRAKTTQGGEMFPPLTSEVFRAVMPLPLLFFANTVSGLGATKQLNVPMFVLLRRFSIVMTLCLEAYLLGRVASRTVQVSVAMMVLGAVVAAGGDLQLDASGYTLIFANDLFTALQGVVLRQKLDKGQRQRQREVQDGSNENGGDPQEDAAVSVATAALAADSLLFYNALFSIPMGFVLWIFDKQEVHRVVHYAHWGELRFWGYFLSSLFLGFGLNYTYFLCTKVNSPLTTTVVGSMKNVLSSYLGMLVRDYRYSALNFLGVNISVVATMVYSIAEIQKVRARKRGSVAPLVAPSVPAAGPASRGEEVAASTIAITVPVVDSAPSDRDVAR